MTAAGIFSKIMTWLDHQAKLRKDEFVAVGTMSRSVRIGGALIPAMAFFIVIFLVYSSANEDSIMSSTGVRTIENWNWTSAIYPDQETASRECHEQKCWKQKIAASTREKLHLPKEDPVLTNTDQISKPTLYVYSTTLSRRDLNELQASILYLPGIRAKYVSIWFNGRSLIQSPGGLPYFVDISGAQSDWNTIEIATTYEPTSRFRGFIDKPFFVGNVLSVYRTHFRLTFRSFPEHAVVIFLLSIGALTFAFFIFLDHKQELFALGLTISLLGAAMAVQIGILAALQSSAFFLLFAMHISALCWYASEMIRINVGYPKRILIGGVTIIALYFALAPFDDSVRKPLRYALLIALDLVPLVLGPLCLLAGAAFYSKSRERSVQLIISGLGMIAYGFFLLGYDQNLFYSDWLRKTYEIPLLGIVTSWIISALSSLGSMERRVQIAVKDREQRLKLEHEIILAQEVQQSFISSGAQVDDHFEVHTIYQAVKRVGGDWVTWRILNDRFSIGIIGDVVGKGVQAGLIVSACDSTLRLILPQISARDLDPNFIIRTVVSALHRAVIAPHPRRAMTLAILIADQNGEITYTTLGHPPLLQISQDGSKALVVRNGWLSPDFNTEVIQIGKVKISGQDTIVGYTDGVCDGSRQLREFRNRIADWFKQPFGDIEAEYAKVEPDYDDQTLLLLRLKSAAVPQPVGEAS